ncbi:MAG: hypothetical protein KGN84_10630 [Acidobacteriota bacterium]|nr:hypothetical protein [Acidobacteriota bacterium]
MNKITWLCVLSAVLPAVVPAAQLACEQPGKERWPVKTSLPAHPKNQKMSLADALDDANLPPLTDVKTNDARFDKTRITGEKVNEDRVVTLAGWVYLVAFEADDCDFHIQISPDPYTSANLPTKDSNSMIVEVPSGQYATEISDQVEAVRSWVVKNLLAGADPRIGSVHVMKRPAYISVTGALFYDDDHSYRSDHTTGRGKKGLQSKTLWEVHPIVSIAFAPAPK